jgi:hypothetical protein
MCPVHRHYQVGPEVPMPSDSSTHAATPPHRLPPVLWIGGAQWAGKTTVAWHLARRYPLISYDYDYHDARAHSDRARADPERYPRFHKLLHTIERDPDAIWVRPDAAQRAAATRRIWDERFRMVLDDLEKMPSGVTVLAEGWGLRPDFVAPLLSSPRQAIFLVPTEEFRQHQLAGALPRAAQFPNLRVTDRERAQRNRVERDRLLAHDVVERAEALGLRVVHVDGSLGPEQMRALVEEHFRPFLPTWIY